MVEYQPEWTALRFPKSTVETWPIYLKKGDHGLFPDDYVRKVFSNNLKFDYNLILEI